MSCLNLTSLEIGLFGLAVLLLVFVVLAVFL